MNSQTMASGMAPAMKANEAHKVIPGNPSTATSSQIKLNDRSNGKPLQVLSETDWKFWVDNGYVIVKNAVPKEQVQKLADYLWEYEGKDANDIESWYKKPNAKMQMAELNNTGMVEIYNHQFMWDNRQFPKVHQAFADVWGTEKLWVTIDRANLNFPLRPGFEYKCTGCAGACRPNRRNDGRFPVCARIIPHLQYLEANPAR
jgi:hypothetical protein